MSRLDLFSFLAFLSFFLDRFSFFDLLSRFVFFSLLCFFRRRSSSDSLLLLLELDDDGVESRVLHAVQAAGVCAHGFSRGRVHR